MSSSSPRFPIKHSRETSPGMEILNNLQEWEQSMRDNDKKFKSEPSTSQLKYNVDSASQVSSSSSRKQNEGSSEKTQVSGGSGRQYDYLRNYDTINRLSNNFMAEEDPVDANSEKELGNEYFKQKKFSEAIDCYSRSIALCPTAIAYANRAMAYLKLRRFQEAENDCTEALNLDDRYIKAYSRRSTARKELGKHKESVADAEFALRLEPQNKDIKKQYAEAKSLYEKEIMERTRNRSAGLNGHDQGVSTSIQEIEREVPENAPMEIDNVRIKQEEDAPHSSLESTKRNQQTRNQGLMQSVHDLAAKAATLAVLEASKKITPPTSAYEFEVSWRGFSGNRNLQTRLLKATSPVTLPQIFKNALSAAMLIDIIRCIAIFFREDMDLAIKYLENLVKIPRFDTLIMCLSLKDKAELLELWDQVFTSEDYTEILCKLRQRYLPKL